VSTVTGTVDTRPIVEFFVVKHNGVPNSKIKEVNCMGSSLTIWQYKHID
jgi:hypothetical protein